MAKRRKRWNLKKELAKQKDWLAAGLREGHLKSLHKDLADANVLPQILSMSLESLSTSTAVEGAVQVLEGDLGGWRRLHLAWRCSSWDTKVHIERFDEALHENRGVFRSDKMRINNYTWISVNTAMLNLMTAISFGEDKFADWCGSRMIRSLEKSDPLVDPNPWSWCPFESFALKLYSLWRGLKLHWEDFPEAEHAPYDALINAWNDEEAFADALVTILDYHCGHTTKDGDAFTTDPFSVFPGEIIALRRIRKELGLPFPDVQHPLLDNPLANVPDPFPESEEDELLDQTVARCQELMPSLETPWE